MTEDNQNKRFCEYGFNAGYLPAGNLNTIADVAGVTVGHRTKIESSDVRTGVTIIDPGVNNLFREKIPAAVFTANGTGKVAGLTQLAELGTLETPIALTNTLAVGTVIHGLVELVVNQIPDIQPTESVNAIVGEVNDGFLNNIHKNSIQPTDVAAAFSKRSKKFALGNVGGGTGTRCFSWKGGIGTASRLVRLNNRTYTLGVLAQTNFGGSLDIFGVPAGKILGKNDFTIAKSVPDGSCIIVVATDAPLSARQLERLAKRTPLGLARTGSIMATFSGDYTIAFSTNRSGMEGTQSAEKTIIDTELNNFFLAVVEATQESIYDALFAAETMTGRDNNIRERFPVEQILPHLNKLYALN